MSIRNHFRLPEFRGPHLTDDYSTQNVTAPVRTASSPNSWLSRFSQREARAIFTRFFVGKTSIFSSSIVLLSDSRRQWSIESAHVRSAPFYLFFTFSLRLVNISQNFFFLLWSVMTNGDDLSRPGKGQTLVWISILWRYKSCPQKKEEFLSVSLRNWGRATKESRRDFLLSVVDSSPSPSVFEFSIVDKSITSRTRDTATTVRERFLVLILPSSVGNHGDARHPYAQHSTRMTHRLSLRWCKLLICYFHPR